MKISRFSMVALAAATLVAAASGTSRAASIFGVGGTLNGTPNPSGNVAPPQVNVNEILYHNYEDLFDSNGNKLAAGSAISTGDYLVGILNIDQISPPGTTVGSTFGNGSTSTSEITGVFVQKIGTVTGSGGVGTTIQFTTTDRTTFVAGGTTINTGLAAGEMFDFYLDNGGVNGTPTNPFEADGSVTLAQSFASASNGSELFSLGLNPNPAAGDPNAGYFTSTITAVGPGANFNINALGGLNFMVNNTGYTFNTVYDTHYASPGTGDPIAEGLVLSSAIQNNTVGGSPWDFASRDPADVSVFVPVPASVWTGLSMLGALGGMAVIRRRKALRA